MTKPGLNQNLTQLYVDVEIRHNLSKTPIFCKYWTVCFGVVIAKISYQVLPARYFAWAVMRTMQSTVKWATVCGTILTPVEGWKDWLDRQHQHQHQEQDQNRHHLMRFLTSYWPSWTKQNFICLLNWNRNNLLPAISFQFVCISSEDASSHVVNVNKNHFSQWRAKFPVTYKQLSMNDWIQWWNHQYTLYAVCLYVWC